MASSKTRILLVLGVPSLCCSLVIMVHLFTMPDISHVNTLTRWMSDGSTTTEYPEPDTSWIVVLKGVTSLLKTKRNSHFVPPLPRCPVHPNRSLFLTVVVFSSAKRFAARRAIRATWGNKTHLGEDIKVFFLVGKSLSEGAEELMAEEKRAEGDIIQYDLVDSYNNLTVKSFMMLQWLKTYCRGTQFLLKTDEDMFINIPNLLQYLVYAGKENPLVGYLFSGCGPSRDHHSKYYVPERVYPEDAYPDFLSGTGYVMSQNAASLIYQSALKIPLFLLEDVYITGMCAKAAGLVPKGHEGFHIQKRPNDPCLFKSTITAHEMSVNELYRMWEMLQDHSLHCTR